MTEILDTTPDMDLDIELTNEMDNNDDRHPTDNEQPLHQDDSRPGTPHLTNCEQMKILARNIKYYTITIENLKANIRSLKLHGLTDEDCHIMKEHLQRLDNYTALNALTVKGYDSKGVTQCYKCQQFNHTASNCHIKPKCLKCGEPHQTSECEIDKVETMYCVNCEAYGHMANYSKCPLYPKPRKGATIKPNYTTIVNSLVRPNVSFAQTAAQQEKNKNTAPTPQQMAPRNGQVPTTLPTQTQAATTHIAKQQKTNNAKR
ncbi:nucleic-acid-binding protein from transposon X-element [Trichonephila clavipes]|nr:nucleic-acid-binding protein from transposon X-element [Trichonephila clavipes]